jgi:hypothetical protein
MEHSIHVASGHFIRGVGPTFFEPSRKKGKAVAASNNMDADGGELSGDEDDTIDTGNDDGVAEFNAGDTVGKALMLVTQASTTVAYSHELV